MRGGKTNANAVMLRWGLGLLALGVAVGCATNPVTGRREFSLVSADQELAMGKEGHGAVLAEFGVYENPALQSYVDSVGQALARVSHQPNLEWHFTLLDNPTVNAFALPGGYIYLTRGILAHFGSEAQMAGVLGHEIAHVTARHSAQRVTQQQLAGLGLALGSVFSETFRQYGQVAEQALGLLLLKYSRDNETESDRLGVDYSTAAGYDPREVPETYVTLRRVGERAGQRLPSFLSTHPDPGDRETRTRALAQAAAAGKTGLKINSRAFLQRMDDLVYGNDPRQGYFDGAEFYHPGMNFQLTTPSGWTGQNTNSAVIAFKPDQTAMMQLTIVDTKGASPAAYVSQLQSAGRIADARGTSETIGGSPGWAGRLLVQAQDGSRSELVAAFIQRSDRTYQILGQSQQPGGADDARILASARSFRTIQDPARRTATPSRVDVVPAPAAGPFREIVGRLGTSGVDVDELAILNNVEADETVQRGQLLKVVRAGTR